MMAEAVAELGLDGVDRILLDLGVSSMQLDRPERGFSFRNDGPLDMRMDPESGMTAAELLAQIDELELVRIFREYGEERHARRIAKSIVERRSITPIHTTAQLAALVSDCVPGRGRIHPATRVFQALRMAVNDELGELEQALQAAATVLRPGGRLVVLTFHSLEDRLVKWTMRGWAEDGVVDLTRRKVVKPSREEAVSNRRARSAKLRVCEKI